jgi:hypothetical protein
MARETFQPLADLYWPPCTMDMDNATQQYQRKVFHVTSMSRNRQIIGLFTLPVAVAAVEEPSFSFA